MSPGLWCLSLDAIGVAVLLSYTPPPTLLLLWYNNPQTDFAKVGKFINLFVFQFHHLIDYLCVYFGLPPNKERGRGSSSDSKSLVSSSPDIGEVSGGPSLILLPNQRIK